MSIRQSILIVFVLLVSVGCSSIRRSPAPVVSATVESSSPSGTKSGPKSKTSNAVSNLLKNAQNLNNKGRSSQAAALIERALRIEPRNATVWHQLAKVRYTQKRYQQAESLALRSNQYARLNTQLRSQNWSLIADARDAAGNKPGGAIARKRAQDL